MGRRTSTLVAGLVVASLTLAGCGGSDTEEKKDDGGAAPGFANGFVVEPDDSGEPTRGGQLEVVTYSEARVLDPVQTIANGSSGGTEMAAVYDLLVRYDQDSETYVPQLAEALEPNEAQDEWTLTLRDGVTFSDGTPLDADAVVWSLDRYVEKGGGQASFLTHAVRRWTAVDARTVRFELSSPWSDFGYLLSTGPGMIVAKGSDQGEAFTPIGAGPYEQERYTPQEELLLTAREDYWGGAPALESLRFFPISAESGRLDVLRNGEADMGYLREAPTAQEALEDGLGGFMEIGSISRGLLLNHREGSATADGRIRQALMHALDVDVINQRTAEGKGLVSTGILNELSRWDLETEPLAHDVEAAKELVEAAKADGFDGTISFKGVAKVSEAMGVTLQGLLSDIGLEVSLDYVPSVTDLVNDIYVTRDFDMVIWSFGMPDRAVYPELYEKVHSSARGNSGGSADPELDRLIEELGAATTPEEQQEVLEQIQAQWNETVPYAPLGATPEWNAWGEDVHGIVPSIDSIMLFDGAWKD
ncbi:ABC transporter substrate-binding protein [Nocardioides sp. dk4132]|uniref:ABC transporter substrate-binding protein n=1 Tax=unclassified Nocardioides TaxID=2615069 RepID=UPI001297933B|nr:MULTISPECIES: ABC transporter substrate-binding protein [unclassified Nocardioides]MQW76190.1 ABC transporter substrate-binding protein [Nocardioides sp. dk4132]QGA09018.1 ABC transporter substrate-binding protein [Nocardioides sp. dk884]